MKLLARQMTAVEVVKVWKKRNSFTERIDKGNEINNTVTEYSQECTKGTVIFSMLLVLEM